MLLAHSSSQLFRNVVEGGVLLRGSYIINARVCPDYDEVVASRRQKPQVLYTHGTIAHVGQARPGNQVVEIVPRIIFDACHIYRQDVRVGQTCDGGEMKGVGGQN